MKCRRDHRVWTACENVLSELGSSSASQISVATPPAPPPPPPRRSEPAAPRRPPIFIATTRRDDLSLNVRTGLWSGTWFCTENASGTLEKGPRIADRTGAIRSPKTSAEDRSSSLTRCNIVSLWPGRKAALRGGVGGGGRIDARTGLQGRFPAYREKSRENPENRPVRILCRGESNVLSVACAGIP
jgi:hypothetical protein